MDFSKLDLHCLDIPGWSGPTPEETHEESAPTQNHGATDSRDEARKSSNSTRADRRDATGG